MTTPNFSDSNEEMEYYEADFGHSDNTYAARDHVSDMISDGGCECGQGPTKAEKDWTDLMSARPRADHNPMKYLPESTSAVGPSPLTFKYVAGPLQPPGIEDHALDVIEDHWRKIALAESEKASAGLSKIVKQLSDNWEGEDFDYLAERYETAIKELNAFNDDGVKVCEILDRQGQALNTLQGGDIKETPVPPAQFKYMGESRLDKSSGGTHMRPSFHMGRCIIIDDERAMEMHGIDAGFVHAVHDQIDNRTEEIMEERVGTMSGSQLDAINETQFVKDARDEAKAELKGEVAAYEQELQADYDAEVVRIGDDITHRRNQADDVLHDSPFPVESRLGKGYIGETTLVDPPPPSAPDASGMAEPGGYTPGTVASPEDVASRTSTGSGGSGGSNPWADWPESDSDDKELSDGLSSGSGGAGLTSPGTTAPGGGPAGTGPGGGVGGGVVGPGGRASSGVTPGGSGRPGTGPAGSGPGSRGAGGGASGGGAGRGGGGAAGSGRGPGAAGAGRGMGGPPMGMMGGGPGGGAGQQGGKAGSSSSARGSVGNMGRTSNAGNAPAAGTASGRGTGTTPSTGAGGSQGRGTAAGTTGGRGPGGPGGMGLMGGPGGRGGSSKDNSKGKGDNRTIGSMGRPPSTGSAGAPPAPNTAVSPGADTTVAAHPNAGAGSSKGASKLTNLIAAKRASESKKENSKKARDDETATNPAEDESAMLDSMDYEDMDIHDQQMIEDDLWGAYNKDDDQYR